jgi:mannose-6-phosphate isomerase
LPPGRVHAIGRGVRLFEIQQTSNVTYRVWDWNRPPKRPLHLQQAFDVLSFQPTPQRRLRLKPQPVRRGPAVREEKLIVEKKAGYAAHRLRFEKRGAVMEQDASRRFLVFTVVEGTVLINHLRVKAGQTVVAPKGSGMLELKNVARQATVLKSFCPSA